MGNRVAQLGINVQDLDKAVRDYNDVFGIGFVVLRNEDLGLNIAVSDAGIVLSQSIDPANPSPLQRNWGKDLVTAMEVHVDDLDTVHEKLTRRGVKPVYFMETPGGMREWYYDSCTFYGIPLTATQHSQESWMESIDTNLTGKPEDYSVRIDWQGDWKPWKAQSGKTEIIREVKATTDNKMAQVAFNFPHHLDEAGRDFEEILGIGGPRIVNHDLGLDIIVTDGGLVLSENLDHDNPSPIRGCWGKELITALEIKVPDLDPVDDKLRALGVKRSYYLDTPGGLREWYYESQFYGVPLTVTQYAQDSFIEAIDKNIEDNPDAYAVRILWEPGYESWKPSAKV